MAPPLAAVLVSAGCGAELAGKTAAPRHHVVEIRGMTFQPAELTVAPGDTVVWINRDVVPHTATTGGNTSWDTGILAQGDTGRYIADRPGDMSYICSLHPAMQGRLIVVEPSQ